MKIPIDAIPLEFRGIIRKARRLILTKYKDTRGLFLIGSLTDGTYNESSDIDIVWVKSHKINWERLVRMEESLNPKGCFPRIQMVSFSTKELIWHFDNSSTMAHSIQRGIVLYGADDRLIADLLERKLSFPKKKWMRYWLGHWLRKYDFARYSIRSEKRFHKRFCKTRCHCSVFDDIARVTVNFAILYLEMNNIVPTSKAQIWDGIKRCFAPLPRLGRKGEGAILMGLRLALRTSGKDRYLTIKEADVILPSADWFRRRIIGVLGET